MTPTIAVLSYGRLTQLIRGVGYTPPEPAEIVIIDALLEDALGRARQMEANREADVFVSAGGNAQLLSQHLKAPFVEIKATGFDVLLALQQAAQNTDRVALVSYKSRVPYLDQVAGLLKVEVRQVTYQRLDEVEPLLREVRSQGIETVVGASLVMDVAQQLGMNGVFLYSPDGVTQAMDAAVKIAVSKRDEAERAEALRAILDFAHEGIIATDRHGAIRVFNPSAEKITGISRQRALGHPVDEVLPSVQLSEVVKAAQPRFNQVQALGDIKIVANQVPILVGGAPAGAVTTFQDVDTVQEAEQRIRKKLHERGFLAKATLPDLVGSSEAMGKARRQAALYASTDSTVLITGESGTGKELFAQGIHNASARAKRPFVAVNCAALPENLLESELFGYEEGAFTGARKGGKAGMFELAQGGTIFLDEIGEISMPLQARLLRVLESHEVLRVGGERILPVNVRVVAATNKDLWGMVQEGHFREDIYYRLNVLTLPLPPLRARRGDIPLLASKLLSEMRRDLAPALVREVAQNPLLTAYDWPGNVRELRNMVERIAVLLSDGTSPAALIADLMQTQGTEAEPQHNEDLMRVLREVGGNRGEAAKRLGISRTTLWRRLRALGQA